jgi:hypothetical protein
MHCNRSAKIVATRGPASSDAKTIGALVKAGRAIVAEIADIPGREILDSRGNPIVEAEVVLDSGVTAVDAASRAGSIHPRQGAN